MAPSNSSSPKTNPKLEATVVAMEERRTSDGPKQGPPQEVVLESTTTEVDSKRKITEKPRGLHVGLSIIRAGKNMKPLDPPREEIPLICDICDRRFCNFTALLRHQNIHKADQEVARILKTREPSFSPGQAFGRKPHNSYQGKSHSVDVGGCSQDALSNDKYRGISRVPSDSIRGDGRSIRSTTFPVPPFNGGFTRDNTDMNMAVGYPVAPYGYTSHGFATGIPLVTHNNNHLTLVSRKDNYNDHRSLSYFDRRWLSFGPFESTGGGSSYDYPSFYNGGITMAPPANPDRQFTHNTSDASPSRDPVSLELSLRPPNEIGSCTNNNDNSSAQGLLSLELSLRIPESRGRSNSTSSVDQSCNGQVTGGGVKDLNLPVRPRVSRFHFHGHNPLESIIRNAPLPHPPPNDENVSGYDRKGKKPKV